MYMKIIIFLIVVLLGDLTTIYSKTGQFENSLDFIEVGKKMITECEKLESITLAFIESNPNDIRIYTLISLTKEAQRFSFAFHYNNATSILLFYELQKYTDETKNIDLILQNLDFSIKALDNVIDSFYKGKNNLKLKSANETLKNIIDNLQISSSILKNEKRLIENQIK